MQPDPVRELEIEHYVYPAYLRERELPKWTKEDAVKLHDYHIKVSSDSRLFGHRSKVVCMINGLDPLGVTSVVLKVKRNQLLFH